MWLFNLSDEPVREATDAETQASFATADGIIPVDGSLYYVDEYDDEDSAEFDEFTENWRRELLVEAGMLGGCNAYNDMMGY